MSSGQRGLRLLLEEQITHYRAIAGEYEEHAIAFEGTDELGVAIASFQPCGSVLDLACGQGTWTARLLSTADEVTAVDASPEMLAIAADRVASDRVRFVKADIFTWEPDQRYDAVFFGFWLSHVPLERFDFFWSLVARCLKPGGRVFFVDDAHRSPDELVEGEASTTIRRRLTDGTSHRIVKVPHHPGDLERRLGALGWAVTVTASGPLYWGTGGRS